jgi:hypothetical protein
MKTRMFISAAGATLGVAGLLLIGSALSPLAGATGWSTIGWTGVAAASEATTRENTMSATPVVVAVITPKQAVSKPLPVSCGDRPVQPVWVIRENQRRCADMNEHLIFDSSLGEPFLIVVLSEPPLMSLSLTFRTEIEKEIVMTVGPWTYYPYKRDGKIILFNAAAADTLLRYAVTAIEQGPDFNEKQSRETFFYFKPERGK